MGPSHQSSRTVVNNRQHEDISAKMDASTNIDNEGGRHNIYVPGGTGVGATIYL